eukprot:SAG31_NODE_3028_length_4768_cov_5.420433_6_plen_88_part_00
MRAGLVALTNAFFGWVTGTLAVPVSPAPSSREVVGNMYLEILERPPDNEGIRHYVMNGVSVAQVRQMHTYDLAADAIFKMVNYFLRC